jgi:hypothetical protein
MLLSLPWYLKYYIFPIVALLFMLFLAIQKNNQTNDWILNNYLKKVQEYKNDESWMEKELFETSKKKNHILFNRIHKSKYDILKMYMDNTPEKEKENDQSTNSKSKLNTRLSTYPNKLGQESPTMTIGNYNDKLYNRVWEFLDHYIVAILSPLFPSDDIVTIKQSVFEFFINDRRKIEVSNLVSIPHYLSMQDIGHFFHNLSELMSYYKKLRQSDFFKYLPYFIDLSNYDPQSLYRNSTRTSSSSIIPLHRITENNNMISEFVDRMKKEMPYNQRIIS